MNASSLKRTPLRDALASAGGRMVDFHGWEMPVQFAGILAEHRAVRSACGVFDVSHMGQIFITGPEAHRFVEHVNCNRMTSEAGKGTYSHLLAEDGGILDDAITFCLAPDRFLSVVNAATADADYAWLVRQAAGFEVTLDNASDRYGMVAVQGPNAPALVGEIFPAALELPRFGVCETVFQRNLLKMAEKTPREGTRPTVGGNHPQQVPPAVGPVPPPGGLRQEAQGESVIVMRTGYTGEDGFELAASATGICGLWDALQSRGGRHGLVPCGLGSRDTLRLEAGYLLYGTDADATRTPYEANCGWVVKLQKGEFIGRESLMRRKEEGFREKLTGVRLLGRGVPRPGCTVWQDNRQVGRLTSATFAPSLGAGIGLGYLETEVGAPGTRVEVEIHGKRVEAETVRPPFRKNSV